MSVLLATSLGDMVLDLYVKDCPTASKNFLKLCKIKYYNNCIFHKIIQDFVLQTGDPTGTGRGGESIFGALYGTQARYFEDEIRPHLKHKEIGTVAMSNTGKNQNGSQFYITTGKDLDYLDEKHTIFGKVIEGLDVLAEINKVFIDKQGRPIQNVRIKHTFILEDPFPDPPHLVAPDRSPEPSKDQQGDDFRQEIDDKIDEYEGKTAEEIEEERKDKQAKSNAGMLEMIGDIPHADVKPPENVLFVCKLNQATQEEDLELIFSRFGKILSCEIIRDRKTGDSLCYAFIEFSTQDECEAAYFKMDNVLIDDRRIHVDFSQSVSKMRGGYGSAFARFSNRGNQKGARSLEDDNLRMKKDTKASGGNYAMVFDDETSKKRKSRSPDSAAEKRRKDKDDKRDRDRHDIRDRDYHRDDKRDRDNRDRDRDDRRDRDRDRDHKADRRDRDHRDDKRDRDRDHRDDKRDRDRDRNNRDGANHRDERDKDRDRDGDREDRK